MVVSLNTQTAIVPLFFLFVGVLGLAQTRTDRSTYSLNGVALGAAGLEELSSY